MSIEANNTQFLMQIKNNINDKGTFDTWFKDIKIVKEEKNLLFIAVPNQFIKKLCEKTHYAFIHTIAEDIYDQPLDLKFLEVNSKEYSTLLHKEGRMPSVKDTTLSSSNLNPKYTFDDFIVGESNRFAHAACLAAAEKPAQVYNPLFIYGGVGLGKTHLMHATGHHYLEDNPKAKVLYVSTETFTNEMINAVKLGTLEKFRDKYRNIDLLLIDDIQFLENKEKTQVEFFYTFNALKDAGSQIVISSDDPPNKLKVEERLISRFTWGLTTDISQPDFETRVAILQNKATSDHIILPNIAFTTIAQNVTSNVRELEGALLRVDAYINVNDIDDDDVSEELVLKIIKDITNMDYFFRVNDNTIKKAVASFYGIRIEDLSSKRRTRNIAFPRQVAMFLIRDLTDLSLPKIGDSFGGKDHTTVMHACKTIGDSINTNPELKQVINQIKESLENGKF